LKGGLTGKVLDEFPLQLLKDSPCGRHRDRRIQDEKPVSGKKEVLGHQKRVVILGEEGKDEVWRKKKVRGCRGIMGMAPLPNLEEGVASDHERVDLRRTTPLKSRDF